MGERYLFHVWDDGCVVFDPRTGDTHALDPDSALIFLLGVGADASLIARLGFRTLDEDAAAAARGRLAALALPGAFTE